MSYRSPYGKQQSARARPALRRPKRVDIGLYDVAGSVKFGHQWRGPQSGEKEEMCKFCGKPRFAVESFKCTFVA